MSAGTDEPDDRLAASVAEHRDTLERWADSSLPLADDMSNLLDEFDTEK